MSIEPENQALKDSERIFVHKMVYEGLDRLEAYLESHDIQLATYDIDKMKRKASYTFYKPNVNRYYHAILEEIRDLEVKKGLWTREVATQKLTRLIEAAEEEIYGVPEAGIPGNRITMSRLNAIVLPAKELNNMHGYNQTNVNVEGAIVQIIGEEDIPD